AQIFHHIIMPLASDLDKETEIAWALADFEIRFQRPAEGLWLSECAADLLTLEAVAAKGIKFVLLSPHQAKSVRLTPKDPELPVDGYSLDVGRPYLIDLPSGRNIAAFFYQAELAQNVAFEGLLRDGEKFWQKLKNSADALPGEEALLTLATDGETYGHHFTFGEMALAYALAQSYAGRDNLELTNFGTYLEIHPPTARATLHDPSSWSCPHGVERWRSDCGCSTGAHPGWNQAWRAPLRKALDKMKGAVDAHYFAKGREIFRDPKTALLDFGQVLVNQELAAPFLEKHLLRPEQALPAWQLLHMQENACAAYTSCAWFFDDISGIEPVNGLRFALRAMELLSASGGPELLPALEEILTQAKSNYPEEGNGLDIFHRRVLPSRQDPASICLFAYLQAWAERRLPPPGQSVELVYPSLRVRLTPQEYAVENSRGLAVLSTPESVEGSVYLWNGRLPFHNEAEDAAGYATSLEAREERRPEAIFRCLEKDLARYLRDYLGTLHLASLLDSQRPETLRTARRVLAGLTLAEEGQNSRTAAPHWTVIAPYLPLAVYLDQIPEKALEQIRDLVNLHLAGDEARALAVELLEAALLEDLRQGSKQDAELCAAVKRARAVFEGMDWWRVQNVLWNGRQIRREFMRTAEELGFRS
ncbi:MAG: DUF3536 domain-containing protein, partial [Desulfovibrionaceae bacterium]|nr:DUF3536 domain-containing protein [Desulfovibrionaceae bacterium]